jgi:uncharacterized damage-inducible protein DinB
MAELSGYRYRGARACVLLHERAMREFLETWRRARAAGLTLSVDDDPDYASLPALLQHVLSSARGYMTWICKQLSLPDPEIEPAPAVESVEDEAERYVEHLVERWSTPLTEVRGRDFYRPVHASAWKTEYCIDAMLEHAVMHPTRHTFQLREMMGEV